LHALVAEHMPASWADLEPADVAARVQVGIETDRGTWVQALLTAGYQVLRARQSNCWTGRPIRTGLPGCPGSPLSPR
jgi:hypothetical protein